jgi:hypothetical protein
VSCIYPASRGLARVELMTCSPSKRTTCAHTAMKFVNLTPHTINLPNMTLPPSGEVARVSMETEFWEKLLGVEIYLQKPGPVEGLPPLDHDTRYIVSAMVRLALPNRWDLLSPGELVRDEEGRPIGCANLIST